MSSSLLLDTTDTESEDFVPGAHWAIGVDTCVNDVVLQWKSSEGVYVDILTIDAAGIQVASNATANETYRLTTSTAGSRAFLLR